MVKIGYIYRFLNSDEEIIYVGRTDGEYISNRMLTHSHLPDEAYKEKKQLNVWK